MKGSIKKEGNSWYYIVTLGKKENGKQHQKKKRGFKTKREASKAMNEVLSQYNKGLYVEPSSILYKDFLDQWLDDKKRQVQETTYDSYVILVDAHIAPRLGNIKLSHLKPIHIQNFYNHLSSEKGLAGASIQKIHTLIKDSLKKAVRWELLFKNPMDAIDRPKIIKPDVEVWTTEEANTFMAKAENDPLFMAFYLAYTTGMRQGEILGLRWKDIDFDKKLLMIRQTLVPGAKKLKSGAKSRAGTRTISLPDKAVIKLQKYKKRMDIEKQLAADIFQDNDLVVCTGLGTPINSSNLRRTFHRLIEEAQVKPIRFHDLRHTHATVLLLQNVNPKIVSERLGHADVRLTLDTYSHLLPNMQLEAASKLNEVLTN
ncbi:site-specific integrase [Halobacillus sp. A5]|uniref:site-specific integrase n=1 Tax=Halobacillus sp. A5 TaxID=2880263 RepID=UPI0020A65DBD|nr:site-specific integrase [Halobacillus sp. A5]MCP3029019.1 site-specific integrase [Halobacillus sp. A5]